VSLAALFSGQKAVAAWARWRTARSSATAIFAGRWHQIHGAMWALRSVGGGAAHQRLLLNGIGAKAAVSAAFA